MREYSSDNIRNVAFVGHQGCGKTSLVEALLYNTGAINRLGRVEDGTTVSDWDEDEKLRGISLSTSLIPIEYEDTKINILDTPGFTDFQGETKNAIRVADSVIVLVDAVSGVEVGTELAWEYAKVYQQPIIVVINKMDRENANFDKAMESLQQTFPDHKFIPVMIPIGKESDFKGVINLITMKAYFDAGKDRAELPADLMNVAEAARLTLIEAAAEADDVYLEKYFAEQTLDPDEIRDGMRKAARDHALNTVPVFVTSGTKNIGTLPLLEALKVYTSPPTLRRFGTHRGESEEIEYVTAPQSNDKNLAAYVFKTVNDRYVGTLSFMRVFSGLIKSDSRNFNNTRRIEERFANLMVMRGKESFPITVLNAGDIGVVAKLQQTYTGDTIGDRDKDFTVVEPEFPAPLYSVALTPRTQADSAKMGAILTNLCHSDPTLRWRQDAETNQVLLEGMGEVHVQLTIARAERLGVGIDTQVPKVPYRETITKTAQSTYRHKKQSGGAGQFGEVSLRVEPNVGEGFKFETKIFGGSVSQSFWPSIEKGINQVLPRGVIAGYPIVDVKAVVFDGKEHPVDSKDIAFQIAGREAFKLAFKDASPVLLEPLTLVKITVPETMMGDVMSDLNTRRGRVQGMDSTGNKSIITAQVPLAEMMRYGNDLRSMTGGRGIYTMEILNYERVPSQIADEIVKAHKVEEEQD
jgi:elongation factor G